MKSDTNTTILNIVIIFVLIMESQASASKVTAITDQGTNIIAQLLTKKVESAFSNIDALSLAISKRGVEVWTRWEGNSMIMLSEAKYVPYHPNEFRSVLENFSDSFPKVNPMCKRITQLKEQGVRVGVKSLLKFPFPLSNRLMIHWQYTHLDKNQDEHLIMFSEDDNTELLEEFHNLEEKKHYVLAHTFLCAYWIKPVYSDDTKGNVVGSHVRYMFSGDTGGSIPTYLQNTLGPKTAFDSIEGIIKFVQSKNK